MRPQDLVPGCLKEAVQEGAEEVAAASHLEVVPNFAAGAASVAPKERALTLLIEAASVERHAVGSAEDAEALPQTQKFLILVECLTTLAISTYRTSLTGACDIPAEVR
jgi:hypothetical protein